MNSFYEHGCNKVSTGDILLYAYGESENPEVAEHVKTCDACRAYLEMVGEVSSMAGQARESASGRTVAEIIKSAGEKKSHGLGDIFTALFSRRWLPVPLAAAVIAAIALVIYQPREEAQIQQTRQDEQVPAYVAGLDTEIAELEEMIGKQEAFLRGGDSVADEYSEEYSAGLDTSDRQEGADSEDEVLDYVFAEASAVSDLEVSMNELEYEMGIAGPYNDGGPEGPYDFQEDY